MTELKLNINKIDDDLEGNWWQYIRPDFSFKQSIPSDERENFTVHINGILIHKQKNSEDMYPMLRYHLISQDNDKAEAWELLLKDIKPYMLRNLGKYILRKKELPFGCKVTRSMKNGKVTIKFEPNEFTSYAMTINPKKIGYSQNRIENLKICETNELENKIPTQISIDPILWCNTIENIGRNSSRVMIRNTEITVIDRRIATFKEHDTIWYFIHGINGTIDLEVEKKKFEPREIEEVNFKCSENAMTTYKLQIGDRVSFKGQFKETSFLGKFIQNIRKFEKNGY